MLSQHAFVYLLRDESEGLHLTRAKPTRLCLPAYPNSPVLCVRTRPSPLRVQRRVVSQIENMSKTVSLQSRNVGLARGEFEKYILIILLVVADSDVGKLFCVFFSFFSCIVKTPECVFAFCFLFFFFHFIYLKPFDLSDIRLILRLSR